MTPPLSGAACHGAPQLDRKKVVSAARSIILIGNPNVGKSVLFGALTGKYVTVSNYPGTTVEVTRGSASLQGRTWHVMDTPGTNNLMPMSEDEQVTRDILLKERDYVCLQVCDAKNLRRGLLLSAQLAEAQVPFVLALNMADEAAGRGIRIDADRLASRCSARASPPSRRRSARPGAPRSCRGTTRTSRRRSPRSSRCWRNRSWAGGPWR
jgi:ferrous iron transport protein B